MTSVETEIDRYLSTSFVTDYRRAIGMNVIVVGAGSGSWTMRGLQLGSAIGARVTSFPSAPDWSWADVAVLVKRAGVRYAAEAHAAGVPIVWDALDFWRQPQDNGLTEREARTLLKRQLELIVPAVTIGATQAMADACAGAYLPHHSWNGLEPSQVKPCVQTVAYQGNAAYLGSWLEIVSRSCAARGWRFVINPPDLREVDLIVALRDAQWDGWMCRAWKSGVKLVNAVAAGRPVMTQPSAAFSEIQPPGTAIKTAADLLSAFDAWTDEAPRVRALAMCCEMAQAFRLSAVADCYLEVLQRAVVSCPA